VLFDALAIEWEYEPEGYVLSDGTHYLPDFFLRMRPNHNRRQRHPNGGYWVEIKGAPPTPAELLKLQMLCQETQHHGMLFWGSPGEGFYTSVHFPAPFVERETVDQSGRLDWSALAECTPHRDPPWIAAVTAALSARFEFNARRS
jgi:hypothetical protein